MTAEYVLRTLRQMILTLTRRVSTLESGGGGSGITQLTGDVTAGPGSGSQAATIPNNTVTYAKMQNVSAASRLLGRGSAGGSGDPEELTAGAGLVIDGTTLKATGGGATGGDGSIYPAFVTPVDGDFAWVNQGGASVTVNANGSIFLRAPTSATNNIRIRKKSSAAGSPDFPVTIACFVAIVGSATQHAGLVMRQSSDGKLLTWAAFNNGSTHAFWYQRWNSPTSHNADASGHGMQPLYGLLWLQYDEDASNRYFRYSLDGYNFITMFSESRTTFLTVDEVGFFANEVTNTKECGITIYSFAP